MNPHLDSSLPTETSNKAQAGISDRLSRGMNPSANENRSTLSDVGMPHRDRHGDGPSGIQGAWKYFRAARPSLMTLSASSATRASVGKLSLLLSRIALAARLTWSLTKRRANWRPTSHWREQLCGRAFEMDVMGDRGSQVPLSCWSTGSERIA